MGFGDYVPYYNGYSFLTEFMFIAVVLSFMTMIVKVPASAGACPHSLHTLTAPTVVHDHDRQGGCVAARWLVV